MGPRRREADNAYSTSLAQFAGKELRPLFASCPDAESGVEWHLGLLDPLVESGRIVSGLAMSSGLARILRSHAKFAMQPGAAPAPL